MYIDDYIQVMQPLVINNDVEVTYYSKKRKKKTDNVVEVAY